MVAQAIQLAPANGAFGLQQASRLMLQVVAPWIQDLGLLIEKVEATPPRVVMRLPYSRKLCCGQSEVSASALLALADTAMMFACASAWNGYRPMSSIDHAMQFLRPVTCDVLADARILGTGPATVFGRATLMSVADDKPVVIMSGSYTIM